MKRGVPDHPKTKLLMTLLGLARYQAVGVLESIWHFAASYAKRGDIGRWTNQEIASAIGWDKDADGLIEGLVEARFLDADPKHRLLIHDWQEHCDQTVQRSEEVKKLGFIAPTLVENQQSPPDASEQLVNASQPTPTPTPTPTPEPPRRKQPRRETETSPRKTDPHAEAFKAAIEEAFPGVPYGWIKGDFVQLAAWRKAHGDVPPEGFVALAKFHWDRGKYCPRSAMTIRGLCAGWDDLCRERLKQQSRARGQPPPEDPAAKRSGELLAEQQARGAAR